MKRIHFFEINEQAWCPRALRDGITDELQALMLHLKVYREVLPLLARMMERAGSREIVDLCSGASGPWAQLCAELSDARVRLTDKFPNVPAFEQLSRQFPDRIAFEARSIDATNVPADLRGPRTLFTSFHHFAPADARAVLQSAVDQRLPIGIFEMTERSLRRCISDLFVVPLATALYAFHIKPLRPWLIFLCVCVPLLPLVMVWDAIVSDLRSYSQEELRTLSKSVVGDGYNWEVGRLANPRSRMPITYLIGLPTG